MNALVSYERFAIATAEKAGKLLLRHFRHGANRVKNKAYGDEVSEVDFASDRLIQKLITTRFPDHKILSEESSPNFDARGAMIWTVDPLDGTTNYLMGNPLFGVNLALVNHGEILVGVIELPFVRHHYVAHEGGGARCDGKRIHVSRTKKLDAARVFMCHKRTPMDIRFGVKMYDALAHRIPHVRFYGAASVEFVMIAEGSADAFILGGPLVWDVAPGTLLVREASGRVTDERGRDWRPGMQPKVMVVSNGKIHAQLLSLVKKSL